MAGYSGKPLSKKLGVRPPMTLVALEAPYGYRSWLGDLQPGVDVVTTLVKPLTAVHLFATDRALLKRRLATFRRELEPDGFLWVSWPKKASKVDTDITENVVREVALPLGFVDVKVCAVNDVWSGLKLVIRKSLRDRQRPGTKGRADA